MCVPMHILGESILADGGFFCALHQLSSYLTIEHHSCLSLASSRWSIGGVRWVGESGKKEARKRKVSRGVGEKGVYVI